MMVCLLGGPSETIVPVASMRSEGLMKQSNSVSAGRWVPIIHAVPNLNGAL